MCSVVGTLYMEKKSSYIGARSNLALYYVTLKNQATWQKDKLQHKKAIKPPQREQRSEDVMALAARAVHSYPVHHTTSLDLVIKWRTKVCVLSTHPHLDLSNYLPPGCYR